MLPCPRRNGAFSVDVGDPKEDHFARGTCSYCGSITPESFLKRAEAGEQLGPTDKNYKVYVGDSDKFYFQHLSEDQKIEFVRLLNEKKLKLGWPEFFYTTPYFVTYDQKQES